MNRNPNTAIDELYPSLQPLLFSLAYRMLGSAADAEDIVQEAFLALELASSKQEPIQNIKAYSCRIVTNRCIDYLRSARKQREVYVGPWLPEPLVSLENHTNDPYYRYQQNESLSTAYLLLLQQLSSVERAVFLLREVLQVDYEEIAAMVGRSSTNCRQLFHRAKRSIMNIPADAKMAADAGLHPDSALKSPLDNTQLKNLISQFIHALASGSAQEMMSMLASEATLYSDGGGKVRAAIRPIFGAEFITRFLSGLLAKVPEGFSYREALVNGTPGLVTYVHGQPSTVFSFDVKEDRIAAIFIIVNPDKLARVEPLIIAGGQ
ncbi:RNA polymerase sigma-70 factor [Paenibacillus solisilvae]|uniref:RNA polymerase sigma-70 factor n=1 Tax=Paenibacillus solisilvae TaxID=2486751 RepID=A0ABW0W843_9BACL